MQKILVHKLSKLQMSNQIINLKEEWASDQRHQSKSWLKKYNKDLYLKLILRIPKLLKMQVKLQLNQSHSNRDYSTLWEI